ncbi:MAG: FHA domain-containing protein [Janthinobacterium lividum]
MDILCPKGHVSNESDYCSECGTKITGTAPPIASGAAQVAVPSVAGVICPDCGTPRASATATFCEVCRFNFVTRTSWAAASASPAPISTPIVDGWDVIVAVDPSLYLEPDPATPCPVDEPERRFPLDLPESLIGRRSERRSIFPEVPLNDPGVSHRHAKLLKGPDNKIGLLDVGSANGTRINGTEIAAGAETPLADGDQITLGCWTRLTLRKHN